MTREQFIELAAFLAERGHPHTTFWGQNLPDMAAVPYPTVTFDREKLERFRAHYAELRAFACAVCDVPLRDLTPMHLYAHLGMLSAAREDKADGA